MVVSESKDNERIDTDILRCKADILRAHDIMPPHKEKPLQEPKTQKTDENTARLPQTQAEQIKPGKYIPAKDRDSEQEKGEIPSFDLAKEIMAEQRKNTAIRRKAPGKKPEAQKEKTEAEPVSYTIEHPMPTSPEQDRIIADIVARDIERLRQGDYSADGG